MPSTTQVVALFPSLSTTVSRVLWSSTTTATYKNWHPTLDEQRSEDGIIVQCHDLPDSYYNEMGLEILWMKRESDFLWPCIITLEDETHRSADARNGP